MKTLALAVALLAPTAAHAQTPSTGSGTRARGNVDPNEVVCRRIAESGSRLATSRVCMTRAQWADWQRQQRADTELSQQRRNPPR